MEIREMMVKEGTISRITNQSTSIDGFELNAWA
jgi:hypothetical protein